MMKELVEQELGFTITDTDYESALDAAQKKLRHIIQRYGDSDGARRSADYLIQLVAEAFQGQALQRFTLSKLRSRED